MHLESFGFFRTFYFWFDFAYSISINLRQTSARFTAFELIMDPFAVI